MRKQLKIEQAPLDTIKVDNYGNDILIGGNNLVGDILDWLEDNRIASGGEIRGSWSASFILEVTDGA